MGRGLEYFVVLVCSVGMWVIVGNYFDGVVCQFYCQWLEGGFVELFDDGFY